MSQRARRQPHGRRLCARDRQTRRLHHHRGSRVTNAATGIAQAYCDSQPMLVLSGACATPTQGKGWGAIHELADQAAVTAGFTAYSAMIRYPQELPEWIARAYGMFRGSRPRPVHLSLPRDVLPQPVEAEWKTRRAPSLPMPDPAAIEEAAERLAQAKRPLILVGGGAVGTRIGTDRHRRAHRGSGSFDQCRQGDPSGIPPLSLGCSIVRQPSQQALGDADVVLLVGSQVSAGDHFLPALDIPGDIIRIDIDPAELTSNYGAAVPIQADARAAHARARVRPLEPQAGGATVARREPGPGCPCPDRRGDDRGRTSACARMEDAAFGAPCGRDRDGGRLADRVYRLVLRCRWKWSAAGTTRGLIVRWASPCRWPSAPRSARRIGR